MSTVTIFSNRNRFIKDALNPKIKLEPWMHVGIVELDNGKFGYVIWVWDSRQVIEESLLSKEQEDKIKLYITDHFMTNEIRTNDSYLPLKGGGYISEAISEYFDKQFDNLANGIETYLNLSYKEAINELSNEPKKIELIQKIERSLGPVSTHEQRCINVDDFRDGIKIRCNGGYEVAKRVNSKLKKSGLNTDLPDNSRFITVYFK